MEFSAASDFHRAWDVERDRMIAKHKSDLALQDELLEKEDQELRQLNGANLQKLRAVVSLDLYRDVILPMAEKSLKHEQREIEASYKKRVGLINDKHVKALAQQEVLCRETLQTLSNQSQPVPKPSPPSIPRESIGDQSDQVSPPNDVSTGLDGLEENRRPTLGSFSASQNPKLLVWLCKPLSWTIQNEMICGERRLIMRVQSKKRKASTPKESPSKRLRVDTLVDQTRTPVPKPANEAAHFPQRTITFDEVYQGGNAKHKDIIVEWPAGSQRWYILKCEQHGLRFTKNSVQGAAKHLNGNGHGWSDRNRDRAVRILGYLVTGCNEGLAKLNNCVAEEAYAKGYKPPFPRSKKRIRGRELADKPPVSRAANIAPGLAQEMPSVQNKATVGGRRKTTGSWKGITHPKAFYIYYGRWKDDGLGKARNRIYPVMVLGWDSQNGSGLKNSDLDATGLLKKKAKPPNCYTYDSRKITGWAPGYEDGGSRVRLRKFPVMFFDELQTVGWIPARNLMKFPLDQREVPVELDHPFNAARRWIAEREGFKTWEERERARISARPPPALPLTPADSANAASHVDFAEASHDSDNSGSDIEVTSVGSAATDKMMQALQEKGGEITGDEDYAATDSDSDIDPSLDCEIDDWARSSPSIAGPGSTTNRPWAFYDLRSIENGNRPGTSVDRARGVQASGPTVSATASVGSARELTRQACSSTTDPQDYHITPVSAITQSPERSPEVAQGPGQLDRSRSYNRQPSSQEPLGNDTLVQIIAETLRFKGNTHYNPRTMLEGGRSVTQPVEAESSGTISRPVGNIPVRPSSENAITAPRGQIGEEISPRPLPNVTMEVPETPSSANSAGGRLMHNDDRSRNDVSEPRFLDHTTPCSVEPTFHVGTSSVCIKNQGPEHEALLKKEGAITQIDDAARNIEKEEATGSTKHKEDALPKADVTLSSTQLPVGEETVAPAVEFIGGLAMPELRHADAEFELSSYKNGSVSWERTKEQEDCVQLLHSADRRIVSTSQGQIAITINPVDIVGFSRERDVASDSKGSTVLVLRHNDGSSSRLAFDRSRGSKLGNGKLQARGFIKWLRTVKPDIMPLVVA